MINNNNNIDNMFLFKKIKTREEHENVEKTESYYEREKKINEAEKEFIKLLGGIDGLNSDEKNKLNNNSEYKMIYLLRHVIDKFNNTESITYDSVNIEKKFTIEGYAVGGFIRDAVLGTPSADLDISLEIKKDGDEMDTFFAEDFKKNGGRPGLFGIFLKQFINNHYKDDPSGTGNPNNSALRTVQTSYLSTNKNLELKDVNYNQSDIILNKELIPISIGKLEENLDIVETRTDAYIGLKHISSSATAEEDAYRRDLTINTLFYSIKDNKILDYTKHGKNDLISGFLATPLDPMETFIEDPTRITRILRFKSKYNFILDKKIHDLLLDEKSLHMKLRLHCEPIDNGKKCKEIYETTDENNNGRNYKSRSTTINEIKKIFKYRNTLIETLELLDLYGIIYIMLESLKIPYYEIKHIINNTGDNEDISNMIIAEILSCNMVYDINYNEKDKKNYNKNFGTKYNNMGLGTISLNKNNGDCRILDLAIFLKTINSYHLLYDVGDFTFADKLIRFMYSTEFSLYMNCKNNINIYKNSSSYKKLLTQINLNIYLKEETKTEIIKLICGDIEENTISDKYNEKKNELCKDPATRKDARISAHDVMCKLYFVDNFNTLKEQRQKIYTLIHNEIKI